MYMYENTHTHNTRAGAWMEEGEKKRTRKRC